MDDLPASLTYVSATPSSGSCSFAAPRITCALGIDRERRHAHGHDRRRAERRRDDREHGLRVGGLRGSELRERQRERLDHLAERRGHGARPDELRGDDARRARASRTRCPSTTAGRSPRRIRRRADAPGRGRLRQRDVRLLAQRRHGDLRARARSGRAWPRARRRPDPGRRRSERPGAGPFSSSASVATSSPADPDPSDNSDSVGTDLPPGRRSLRERAALERRRGRRRGSLMDGHAPEPRPERHGLW